MKKKPATQPIEIINFKRADPKSLSKFDPDTKRCAMNCGPHAKDPRTDKERKFLCDDCTTITKGPVFMKNLKLWITGFPSGRAMIVDVIEERKDKPGYFYIRKPGGGTDTTTNEFLFDVPAQVIHIDMTAV